VERDLRDIRDVPGSRDVPPDEVLEEEEVAAVPLVGVTARVLKHVLLFLYQGTLEVALGAAGEALLAVVQVANEFLLTGQSPNLNNPHNLNYPNDPFPRSLCCT